MPGILKSFKARNEAVLSYQAGSAERSGLEQELAHQHGLGVDIPLVIGGKRIHTVEREQVVCPHERRHALATLSQATSPHAQQAIDAAVAAQREWARWTLAERSAVFLKAADLLAGPWRARLNAATMLGQSKTVQQAEIDSACELIDFLRFNVQFAWEISQQQPLSSPGVLNSSDYRPLEGFVYAVTPFNFTAIGGNLATAPVLMGNTVVWKPSSTAALSNYLVLQLLEEAGLPPGVINFVPGEPVGVSAAVLASPQLAGIHFTGSTAVFDRLWQQTAQNLGRYRSYPRLVGETGGKDFVLAHVSADVDALAVGLLRGAFEYQGQKCSAASRAYIAASIWPRVKERLQDMLVTVRMGDVRDFQAFMGAVIDRRAYERIKSRIDAAKADPECRLLTGGGCEDHAGYFIEPTVVEVSTPGHALMCEEIFGPVLTVYVYGDSHWGDVLGQVDQTSPYALTGAVFAQDRSAIFQAVEALRFAAGNFYINDKPTGAVVGQQPFGGARRSGTNDKAGSALNLLRWVSPRTLKETHVPPRDYTYPHMQSHGAGARL
jgi:1-pyrroline-5-carboxylate dehydrogenase